MFWTKKKQTNTKNTNTTDNNNNNKETNILEPATAFAKFGYADYIDLEDLDLFKNEDITVDIKITPNLSGVSDAYTFDRNSFVCKGGYPDERLALPLRLKKHCCEYIESLGWQIVSSETDCYCLLVRLKGTFKSHIYDSICVCDIFSSRNEFIRCFNRAVKNISTDAYEAQELVIDLIDYSPLKNHFVLNEDMVVSGFLQYIHSKSKWYFDYNPETKTVRVTWKNV